MIVDTPLSAHHVPRSPSWRWWVCGVLLLATLLNYMDRQALAQTATELKDRFSLDDARYGEIEQGFSWAFGVGSILFGVLADRFGPRRLYPLVLIGWSIAGIATPFGGQAEFAAQFESATDSPGAGTFRWLLICRTALGLFEAGHWPCALITARQILTPAERPFGNGLLQSGASAGAVLTPLYVWLTRSLGGSWEIVFWTIGAGGLLWVPMWAWLVRRGDLDRPPVPAHLTTVVIEPPSGASGDVWGFVRRFIVLGVIVTCISVSWQFIRAWLPKYLKEFHHYTEAAADLAVAGYYTAADLGCILAGFLVKRIADRGLSVHAARVVVFGAWAGLSAVSVVVPFLGSNPGVLVPALMCVGAGVLGLHPIYYALAQDLPTKRLGVLSGILSAMTWFTVGSVQKWIGVKIKLTGSYDSGFVLAGLAPILAFIVLLVLWKPAREAGGKRKPTREFRDPVSASGEP